MEKGGKQGGVETPELFNIMMEVIFADVFEKWCRCKCGFALNEEGTERLTHSIWADNIFILATSVEEFVSMTQDMTHAIVQFGFTWKSSSLECLWCGPAAAESPVNIASSLTGSTRSKSSRIYTLWAYF